MADAGLETGEDRGIVTDTVLSGQSVEIRERGFQADAGIGIGVALGAVNLERQTGDTEEGKRGRVGDAAGMGRAERGVVGARIALTDIDPAELIVVDPELELAVRQAGRIGTALGTLQRGGRTGVVLRLDFHDAADLDVIVDLGIGMPDETRRGEVVVDVLDAIVEVIVVVNNGAVDLAGDADLDLFARAGDDLGIVCRHRGHGCPGRKRRGCAGQQGRTPRDCILLLRHWKTSKLISFAPWGINFRPSLTL